MDSIDLETKRSSSKKKSFTEHVFEFEDDTKYELLNLAQYSVLGIVPVIALNKSMNNLFAEADDTRSSLELLIELIAQILFIIFGMYLIHRLITYIPTYSGEPMPALNLFHIVLFVLVITLSLQTKIGQKGSILYERVMELWHGESNVPSPKQHPVQIRTVQPIHHPAQQQHQPQHEELPPPISAQNLAMAPPPQQQEPNYDAMYQQSLEPMAANDFAGGAFSNY
jgi:hypothetical protein